MTDTGYMEATTKTIAKPPATTCVPIPNAGWTFTVLVDGVTELGTYAKLTHHVTRRCLGWSWTAANGTTGTAKSELKAVVTIRTEAGL